MEIIQNFRSTRTGMSSVIKKKKNCFFLSKPLWRWSGLYDKTDKHFNVVKVIWSSLSLKIVVDCIIRLERDNKYFQMLMIFASWSRPLKISEQNRAATIFYLLEGWIWWKVCTLNESGILDTCTLLAWMQIFSLGTSKCLCQNNVQ